MHGKSIGTVVAGAFLLVAALVAASPAWGTSAPAQVSEPPAEPEGSSGEPQGVRLYYSLEPLDKLLSYPDETVVVAVVRSVGRDERSLAVTELGTTNNPLLRASMVGRMRDKGASSAPFTVVTVELVETLKGDVAADFEVWERRGANAELRIESDDPVLEVGESGLLIAGSTDGGQLVPLIFSEIDPNGYLTDPRLHMTVDALRARIAGNRR